MITNSNSKVIYNGDGSTTTFPYTFKIFQDSDLVVVLQDSAGNETTQTLNSDYTVTGAGNDSGGNVVFTTAPASGYSVIIYRDIPLKQEVDYVPNDPFPAETHEEALDRLTMIAQQLQEQLNRALLRDLSQSSGLTLPALVASKYLYTDGSTLQWVTPSTVDYDGTISRGLDANKPASPTVGDVYFATDTLKIYICKTAGTWSEHIADGSTFQNLANIPSGAGDIPAANLGNAVLLTGAQTIAGAKTLSDVATLADGSKTATNAAPTADEQIANKKYVDDNKFQQSDISGLLGAWASKSNNTVYQAATDGFVLASARNFQGGRIEGYTDASNPPTTLRIEDGEGEYGSNTGAGFCMPVKKGDYWKVTISVSALSGYATRLYWIPLGS